MLLSVLCIAAAAFSIRMVEVDTTRMSRWHVTEALSALRPHNPMHIDIVTKRVFEDEVIIDATLYTTHGKFYTASARAGSLTPALYTVSSRLATQLGKK